ncbi:proteasome regulatory particle base subunit Rpn10 [Malassezia pachydermatis]
MLTLALKHRQNKNQRQRVIVFVGSPVADTEESLVQLAKKLKKNNVAIDILSFGEEAQNEAKLNKLIETVNNNDNSHLVTVPPGAGPIADTLISSPIVMEGGDNEAGPSGSGSGGAFEFGVDPNMDPELAMALRLSMEEEQARQRAAQQTEHSEEAQPATEDDMTLAPEDRLPAEGATGSLVPVDAPSLAGTEGLHTDISDQAEREDALLQQALALSKGEAVPMEDEPMESNDTSTQRATVAGMNEGDEDEEMTEEEAIARAIEMSLKDAKENV